MLLPPLSQPGQQISIVHVIATARHSLVSVKIQAGSATFLRRHTQLRACLPELLDIRFLSQLAANLYAALQKPLAPLPLPSWLPKLGRRLFQQLTRNNQELDLLGALLARTYGFPSVAAVMMPGGCRSPSHCPNGWI
jgi:hypothetical protein